MKVGDLVRFNLDETLRGYEYEKSHGLVVDILYGEEGYSGGAAVVNFGGHVMMFAVDRLRVINEKD